jgi:cytochrome c553
VEDWTPQEFHWIVYEGVKMSGMPAWPAEREDEVWALVAFLEALPEIDGPDYERMISAKVPEKAQLAAVDNAAAGPLAEAGEDVPGLAYCATCHGISGASDNRYIPRLDIQNAPYLENSLEAYHTGARQSGIMAQAVTMVPPEALPKLAEHYARQPTAGAAAREPAELALVDVGRDLAQAKPADRDIPACSSCHGPGADRREAGFPSLSGQHREYLEAQLHLWRTGNRGGGEKANLMKQAAQELTDADIKALAAYYASLAPARMPPVKTVVD